MLAFAPPRSFRFHASIYDGVPDIAINAVPASNHYASTIDHGYTASGGPSANFGHIVLLVCEAVLEVVCVSLPGYIIARMGMFNAEQQKFIANLNVQLFTPCLIFTKLASQLTIEKIAELAIIPLIFVVQTVISLLSAWVTSKCFGFKKRARNFVTAMAIFGNSNSLPISLVISLSKTLKGLHWDRIPGDNDDDVAARGILYLLIFQQLGQLVRWSWGYHVLLASPEKYLEEEGGTRQTDLMESGHNPDDNDAQHEPLLGNEGETSSLIDAGAPDEDITSPDGDIAFGSESTTEVSSQSGPSSTATSPRAENQLNKPMAVTPLRGNLIFDRLRKLWKDHRRTDDDSSPHTSVKTGTIHGLKCRYHRLKANAEKTGSCLTKFASNVAQRIMAVLPRPIRIIVSKTSSFIARFFCGVWAFMNPPLWAMLAAIIVASVPKLQHLFFTPGTFVENSVTRAISQSGDVAVPLILVVLGANLARNTLPQEDLMPKSDKDSKEERNILIASILSRMLLPTICMTPLIALTAWLVPVSILDDPIFIIVCFLLIGSPSALQLAQICQLNNVYIDVMSKLLFQSYVIWILPSTLVLVLLGLEVLQWAQVV